MGTSAQSVEIARPAGLPLVRRDHARWLVRAPGQRGALSPEEVAHALKAKRAELRKYLDWRRDVAGLREHVRDELVDEAIGIVVMSSQPIRDEQHLEGAFWVSIGYLLMAHRSGRRDLHVGSRRRVEFEPVAEVLPSDDDEPFDLVAARERIATAADLMAHVNGAGVYRVAAELDGQVVWSGTPSVDEGRCVAHGLYDGALNFHSNQPCPQETGVNIEVPTTTLAEGQHELAVIVEDAAGSIATVYNGTINIDNRPPPEKVVLAPLLPNRGACNGTPCDEAAKLIVAAGEPMTITRTLGHTAVTLTGHLTSPQGGPIKDAQVKLLQQIVGSAAVTQVAGTTTSADGSWSLKAPAGPSRLLHVAFYSHTLDATPASILDFHESVQGAVSMHAPRRVRLGKAVTFTGQLDGGYVPAGGESVQVEIFYSGRWRTIEVLSTTSNGRWTYKYVFTLGVGSSYTFRVVTVPNGGYPYISNHSKTVRVTVVR
jgi:hypothetical protein